MTQMPKYKKSLFSRKAYQYIAQAGTVSDPEMLIKSIQCLAEEAARVIGSEWDNHSIGLENWLEISELKKHATDFSLLYKSLAILYARTAQFRQAVLCARQAEELIRRYCSEEELAEILNTLGGIYLAMHNYAAALEYLLAARHLTTSNIECRKSILSNTGIAYTELGHFQEALLAYEDCLALAATVNDIPGTIYSGMGIILMNQGQYKSALEYMEKALNTFSDQNDAESVGFMYGNMALVHKTMGNAGKLQEYADKAFQILQHYPSPEGLASYHVMADALIEQGKYQDAIQICTTGLDKKVYEQSLAVKLIILNDLCRCYEALGEFQRAMEFQKQIILLKDEINHQEKEHALLRAEVQASLELVKTEYELYRVKNQELLKLIEELEALQKEKDEVLSIAAHDLKNPIYTIRMIANVLAGDEGITDKERKDLLQDMLGVSSQMLDIIADTLDANALDRAQSGFKGQPVNFAEVLQFIIRSVMSKAEARSIKINYSAPSAGDDVIVYADEIYLRRVIENLLSNALKFSPSGTEVSIHLSEPAPGLTMMEITDQGQGLSEDDLQKLFSKFSRLSARPLNGESSTGLGLAIVKKLITLMGGRIYARSQGKDKGATFTVELRTFSSVPQQP
jgi:signal transduction histidine kinase/Flp pilus assembly protein TadD